MLVAIVVDPLPEGSLAAIHHEHEDLAGGTARSIYIYICIIDNTYSDVQVREVRWCFLAAFKHRAD